MNLANKRKNAKAILAFLEFKNNKDLSLKEKFHKIRTFSGVIIDLSSIEKHYKFVGLNAKNS